MFNDTSASCFHRLFYRIFGFILFSTSVAAQASAITNEPNTTSASTSKQVEEPGFPFNIPLFPAVGAIVTVGALVLLTSVVIVYCKRTKQRDLESGRKRRKESNEYDSHTLKYEENALQNQVATAAAADDSHRESENDDDLMDDGHYTRVEIVAGGSKGGAAKNASAEVKKTADSSDAYALYMKSKKKVKVSNPLYSQVVKNSTNGTNAKDVEDLYTKVSDKKKRKESSKTREDIYTKSNKHQNNGASATTSSETDDDLYTKSLKQKKQGAPTSETSDDLYTKSLKQGGATTTSETVDELYSKSLKQGGATTTSETVDELYTKPRKKRIKVAKTDADAMYSKPQKKKKKIKRAPFYMNSVKVVQDNELYTDCPN